MSAEDSEKAYLHLLASDPFSEPRRELIKTFAAR
jgi:hypothetical protein